MKALILVEPAGIPSDGPLYEAVSHIPQLFVWGDFMSAAYEPVHAWVQAVRENTPKLRQALEAAGTDYTWMSLPDMGIKGNSHMLMMDNNNDEIAGLVFRWLAEKGLADAEKRRWTGTTPRPMCFNSETASENSEAVSLCFHKSPMRNQNSFVPNSLSVRPLAAECLRAAPSTAGLP